MKRQESKASIGVDVEVARWAAGEVGVVSKERACESGETSSRACRVSGFVVLLV